MKRSAFLPSLQITGAMIIVGSNIVVGKLISNSLPLFLASTLRFALASALLLLLVLRVEKQFPRIMKRDLFGIFLLSFCNYSATKRGGRRGEPTMAERKAVRR
jgi:drug/metabolite transporter (DMT)-like permease